MEMKKHGYWLTFATMVAAVLVTQAAVAQGGNKEKDDEDEQEIPFEEASLFFELNDTDGDLGIHGFVDGDEWKKLEIEDPFERSMLHVQVQGRLRRQGLTEVFFESAEPSFDELAPTEFFKRFPEGEYEISGVTLDGDELESVVVLSHVMPAPASNLTLSGIPAAENCDADPLPSVSAPVTIGWDPVTQSHPTVGKSGAVEVVMYQLIVEREDPSLLVFSVDLPPNVTEFEIPPEFTELGDEFKFELLTRSASGNQTATESCFEIE
jgi:hypothetical protein